MYSLKSKGSSLTRFNSYLNLASVRNFIIVFLFLSLLSFKTNDLNKSTSSHIGLVKLQIDDGTNDFRTDIYFNTNASLGLDPGYDASLFGGVAPNFSVYSLLVEDNTGMPLGIQALGENDMNGTIVPIGIHALQGDLISVQITENTISPSVNIYLEDTVAGTLTLLNSNNYEFTAQENISGTGRFFLRFGADVLSTNQQPLDELKIYSDFKFERIVLNGQLDNNTTMKLYDINGRIVFTKRLDVLSTMNTINVSGMSTGVYILELNDNIQRRTQKLIIN